MLEPDRIAEHIIFLNWQEQDRPEYILGPAQMIENVSHHAQVIVATQSERLLNSFLPEDIIVADHQKERQCSSFRRLNRNQLREWLDDYSMAELWEKNLLGGQP